MSAYADYTFYTTDYGGTAIAEEDFDPYAIRASAVIDSLTFDRAAQVIEDDEDPDLVDAIQKGMCAVADEMVAILTAGHAAAVKSEKVGGHSVTYADTPETGLSAEGRYRQAAKRYLGRNGLMYPGFYSDEYGSSAA